MSTSPGQRETANPLKTKNVTAVLGPTNTGKTHLAIERMLAYQTGMIGLPLRLLAREVYDRVVARVGADSVALITGEEKIKPKEPRFWVCTVEAMPRDIEVDFLAIDEVQLAADPERGHVFTERLYYARGMSETLLLGAGTMREAIRELMPAANFISRPRLSKLTFAGQKKLSRLPRRTAIVAFSAAEVYEIAELIRRQRGGAAVVLGAQSPRTRNAQVALYQAGDVEYLVATDAIGMGLNLDIDHVAFAAMRKYDGRQHRDLSNAELGQIAGRAGRHLNDGTFGVTAEVQPFESDVIDRLEKHEFEPIKVLQWRNGLLDFSSLDGLRDSLREVPINSRLTRARMADDTLALENLSGDAEIRGLIGGPEAVKLLWDVCQVPDYRKVSPANHAELLGSMFRFLIQGRGRIPEDWLTEQVAQANRSDGDIDTLANRIAHIRTWTFVSNRSEWLVNAEHWQDRTREIEDMLSDAMHEQLTQRFVDKRTSTLMRRLRDDGELSAEFGEDGAIHVEKHFVGKLTGFRFVPETTSETLNGKAARHAAAQVLTKELAMRARRVASARPDAFKLVRDGEIEWRGEVIAKLEPSDDPLQPAAMVLADEHLAPADKEKVQTRISEWLNEMIGERLKPLVALAGAEDVAGLARGIAFRLKESFGTLKRETVAAEMRQLDQDSRAQLRRHGVRFGAFNIYFPLLLKPASCELLATLWRLNNAGRFGGEGQARFERPRPGLTSVPADKSIPDEFYRVGGFHLCGPRAVRVDMLERLADMIRPLTAWRADPQNPAPPPKGATGDGGFTVVPEMMSILGCSAEELGLVLKSLGFHVDRQAVPSAEQALAKPPAPSEVAAGEPDAEGADPAVTEVSIVPGQPAVEIVPEASAIAVAADEEAPDTAAFEAAPEPAAAETPANSVQFIEIWRPRRRRHEGRDEQRAGQQRGRHDRSDRRPGKRQHQQPAAAPPVSAEGQPMVTASPADAQDGSVRDHQRDGGRDDRRHQHKRDRHHGRDKRKAAQGSAAGESGRQQSAGGHQDRRQEKRQTYDPNSPFAALSALKQQLEQQRRS